MSIPPTWYSQYLTFYHCPSPLIGGVLSHPADKWEWFDRPFWREFPYFFPCAISATVSLTAFVAAILWLREVSVVSGYGPEGI